MRAARLLALLLIGLALFVQSSAYAAARPAPPQSMDRHCQDMMIEHAESMAAHGDEEPRRQKRLDCLVAMDCIAPLFLADSAVPPGAIVAEQQIYASSPPAAQMRVSRGPEPPPPEVQI